MTSRLAIAVPLLELGVLTWSAPPPGPSNVSVTVTLTFDPDGGHLVFLVERRLPNLPVQTLLYRSADVVQLRQTKV